MPDDELKGRAEALLALHQPGNPVILPTVWDAWSARLAVAAGFAALTVGSHPVADSIGKPDNEGMTFDDVVTRVAQITAAVDVPISVDIESGYAEAPARLIDGLLSVGAVGLTSRTPCTVRAAGCGRPTSMPNSSVAYAQRLTHPVCTSSSTRAPTCSCARTATKPTGSTGRSPG